MFRPHGLLLAALAAFVLASGGCSTRTSKPIATSDELGEIRGDSVERPKSEAELRRELYRFAYRFGATLSYAFDQVEAESDSLASRAAAHDNKVAYTAMTLSIAIREEPVIALLDMLAMVTLIRMDLEDYWVPEVFGKSGDGLVRVVREQETDVWGIAVTVLSPEQLTEVRELITEWHERHPDMHYVESISFLEFADELGSDSRAWIDDLNLLSEVSEASRSVDEARLLGERYLVLSEAMPFLVRFQVESAFYDIVRQEEVQKLLVDHAKLGDSLADIAKTVQELPGQVAQERSAALNEFMQLVAAEREAAIDQAAARISGERKALMEDLEETQTNLGILLREARETLAVGNELAESVDSLVARLVPEPSGSENPDEEGGDTIAEVTGAAGELRALIEATDRFVSSPGLDRRIPEVSALLEDLQQGGDHWIDHAFLLGVVLILVFLAGGVLSMLLYRYLARKLFGVPARSATASGSTATSPS